MKLRNSEKIMRSISKGRWLVRSANSTVTILEYFTRSQWRTEGKGRDRDHTGRLLQMTTLLLRPCGESGVGSRTLGDRRPQITPLRGFWCRARRPRFAKETQSGFNAERAAWDAAVS